MITEKSMIALSMTVFLRAACQDECDLSMRGYEIDRDTMDLLHQQHSLRMARQSLTKKAAQPSGPIGRPDSANLGSAAHSYPRSYLRTCHRIPASVLVSCSSGDTQQKIRTRYCAAGPQVIEQVRKTQPAAYMKICALLVPKEMRVERSGGVSELSDEQLDAAIVAI